MKSWLNPDRLPPCNPICHLRYSKYNWLAEPSADQRIICDHIFNTANRVDEFKNYLVDKKSVNMIILNWCRENKLLTVFLGMLLIFLFLLTGQQTAAIILSIFFLLMLLFPLAKQKR
jgi:hypothetical protein